MRTLALLLMAAAALVACDQRRTDALTPGAATEADVRQQFGEPTLITEKADGSKLLEYPRQPEGSTNLLVTLGPDGKLMSVQQQLTPENFAKVQPGMAQAEVRKLLGKPAREQRYALKPDETHWFWRFQPAGNKPRQEFDVTFDRDARVISTQSGDDPRDTHTGG